MLFRLIALAFGLILFAPIAQACPNEQRTGVETLSPTWREVRRAFNVTVEAGGRESLERCGYPVRGYVGRVPTLVLHLTNMHRIETLRVRASSLVCDPILILSDAEGQWLYNDDGGMGQNASIELQNPTDGRYALWVGSYARESCAARVTVDRP